MGDIMFNGMILDRFIKRNGKYTNIVRNSEICEGDAQGSDPVRYDIDRVLEFKSLTGSNNYYPRQGK